MRLCFKIDTEISFCIPEWRAKSAIPIPHRDRSSWKSNRVWRATQRTQTTPDNWRFADLNELFERKLKGKKRSNKRRRHRLEWAHCRPRRKLLEREERVRIVLNGYQWSCKCRQPSRGGFNSVQMRCECRGGLNISGGRMRRSALPRNELNLTLMEVRP